MLAGRMLSPIAWVGLGMDHAGFEEVHIRLQTRTDVDLSLLFEGGNVGSIQETAIMQQGISRMQVLRGFPHRAADGQIMGLQRSPADARDDRTLVQQRTQAWC